MGDFAIRTEGLGKKYQIDRALLRQIHTGTFRDALVSRSRDMVRRLSGRNRGAGKQKREDFWALRDVSIEIGQGDVVGIIGRNGAGKSTLLKILSRITEPTEGRMMLRGRVASLLEVGTGFHPELTGAENIYLNGSILGMTRQEIRRKFDEIVAFSEVERFLETPVKRYSSGMYVRLAFAVAAHLEPEILLVDEVLAVGDLQFQRKCIGKMEQVGGTGRTVVFVSHNMSLINNLCRRGIMLADGCIYKSGDVKTVVNAYVENSFGDAGSDVRPPAGGESAVLATDRDVDILDFMACDEDGERRNIFRTTEPMCMIIRYRIKNDVPGLRVGFDFLNTARGEVLFRSYDDDIDEQDRSPGLHEAVCTIPPNLLMKGLYVAKLAVSVHRNRWITHDKIMERVTVEHVDGINSRYADTRPGAIMPELSWRSTRAEPVS